MSRVLTIQELIVASKKKSLTVQAQEAFEDRQRERQRVEQEEGDCMSPDGDCLDRRYDI